MNNSVNPLHPEIVSLIRNRSESGQLVAAEEIYHALLRRRAPAPDKGEPPVQLEALIGEIVEQNEELKTISDGRGVSYYYSSRSMSEPYARILARRGEDPLSMMAEVIRENSQRYPRPVPLGLFEESPFRLTPQDVSACLKKMTEHPDLQDIRQTTTSIGTVFLYSRKHLEPEHASLLAEWLDVGQSNNP